MGEKDVLVKHGVNILKMLNEAIGRLHIRGYAHRNITPDNILISPDYKELKLIGFNLCHHKDRHVTAFVYGTLPYWNSENRHWSVASHRWDFMSFGIICFEMMKSLGSWTFFKTSTTI
jgi:serine/threonine protein kinase